MTEGLAELIKFEQATLDRERSLTVTSEFIACTGFDPEMHLVAFKEEDQLQIFFDPTRDTHTAVLVGPAEHEKAVQSIRSALQEFIED